MKWSFHLARIAGIDLKVHATFFLIVVLGAMQFAGFGLPGLAFGALLILLLFACVTLHEFGHALAAQRYGIPVREIMLLPIGGVAVLSRNPDRPIQELVIAAAGPAVNVVIGLVLAVLLSLQANLMGVNPAMLLTSVGEGPSLRLAMMWLLNANILLVLFNLIPAFPMDGGRIFRALLGFFLPWSRATRIAAGVGQVMALGMAGFGLFTGNLMLVLVAVLIFFGAGSASVQEQARTVLNTMRVGDACNKHALALDEHDRVGKAVDYLLTSYQPDFAVMRGRDLLGILQRQDVLDAMADGRGDAGVFEIMTRHYPRLPAALTLDQAMERLAAFDCRIAAVYDQHAFVGLISAEDIAEAHAILSSMGRRPGDPAPRIVSATTRDAA